MFTDFFFLIFFFNQNSPYEKTLANQRIAPLNVTSVEKGQSTPVRVKQIHQKAKTRYEKEARKELLGEGTTLVTCQTGLTLSQ